ncbi:hypothetical protein BCV72DRAFT_310307 [Rhizopus microsporus var. microsporus]|uniref:Uncharacterized protein n=2 Tax=Rhizopus microsporus TaxID=58291 RepID=A0A2G4SW80_RHIZD|nr:uncharacterized protein RHIMIDRAFT_281112 [Rhizopus microsporus ATCC 52813]ORE01139.1 hypothetical protein BCV72DRAFT_310307 [Rhizopus microsporus var. microsporus]PHZ12992.1 hypothetical protein RHIMIDRAFT_281112 [Rhizopus microsporus ATCC 52813]
MQFKLLTLALLASFFATGFTAPIYPGLTEAESISISPLVQVLGLENPTKEQAGCIAKVIKNHTPLPLNGTPIPPMVVHMLNSQWERLYQMCLQNPIGFK